MSTPTPTLRIRLAGGPPVQTPPSTIRKKGWVGRFGFFQVRLGPFQHLSQLPSPARRR